MIQTMLVADLYSVTPAGQLTLPVRAGDSVRLGLGSGGARARGLKHLAPAVQHRHHEVAALGIGNAENVGFLAEVQPSRGIQRIGVGAGNIPVRYRRECSKMGELAHRGAQADRLDCIGRQAPGHFQGDQRIAVDVNVRADFGGLLFAQLACFKTETVVRRGRQTADYLSPCARSRERCPAGQPQPLRLVAARAAELPKDESAA